MAGTSLMVHTFKNLGAQRRRENGVYPYLPTSTPGGDKKEREGHPAKKETPHSGFPCQHTHTCASPDTHTALSERHTHTLFIAVEGHRSRSDVEEGA